MIHDWLIACDDGEASLMFVIGRGGFIHPRLLFEEALLALRIEYLAHLGRHVRC